MKASSFRPELIQPLWVVWQVPFLGKSLRFSASFSSVRMTSRRSAASVWSWMVMRRYALRDQVGSPVSEGERLAGAGPGDNEQGRAAVPDRLLLGGVQLPGVPGSDVADLGLGWCLLHENGSRYSVSRGSGSGQPPGVHTRTGLRETIIEVGRFGREGRGSGDDALS